MQDFPVSRQQTQGIILKKANLLKSSLISGTLILTITGCISRFIGFYYKIFLSRTIGAEGLGIYQLIFPVFALFLSVSAAGMQTSISRFCAGAKNNRDAKAYLFAGLSVSVLLSVFCMLIVREKADWLCHIMMEDTDGSDLLYIMSWAIPLASIHSCINGYYYGKKRAMIPAVSQLTEQFIRVSGVWLLFQIALEQGRSLTVSGAVWGILIGELAATLYCITAACLTGKKQTFFSKKRIPGQKKADTGRQKTVRSASESGLPLFLLYRNLLSLAVPLTINRILTSVSTSVEALLIPLTLRSFGYTNPDALSVYGILTGMVFSTIMFPAVISNSLSVMLLPAVSQACCAGRNDLVRKAVRQTVEICTILGLVCTFGFLLTGNWIGTHLFHNTLAGSYLETLCWICPFIFLGSTLGSILHGLGRATATLVINLSSSLLRIAFIYFGIPLIGLKAYLWGMLISQIWSTVIAYLCIRKFKNKADKSAPAPSLPQS